MVFLKALNGGQVKQGSSVGVMVNPMSRYWKNFTAAKIILKDQPYSWKVRSSAIRSFELAKMLSNAI